MYKIGDFIVHKNEVCMIKDIKKKYIKDFDYYVLEDYFDKSLTIKIPVESPNIRSVLSEKEALNLIDSIPNVKVSLDTEKQIEHVYKELFNSGNLEDLIKIIKLSYLRNEKRALNNKKPGEIDNQFFNKAERLLYSELSISLNKNYSDTKNFVIDRINKKV